MQRRTEPYIKLTLVPEAQRMDIADRHFGIRFPLTVEPAIFQFATQLAPSYAGGYWHFYTLSNAGFFMAPRQDAPFQVVADNGYEGELSPEALGITVCLYAYSNLSFMGGTFAENCATHYHLLLDFAMLHPEARAIRAAID